MSEQQFAQVLKVNALGPYLTPANPTLVKERAFKEYNFGSQSYSPGETMEIRLNTGSDAINGKACYVKLRVDPSIDLSFGVCGTAYLLVKSVRLSHRNGSVLEYSNNAGVLGNVRVHREMSAEDFQKFAPAMGYSKPSALPTPIAAITIPNGAGAVALTNYVLPLRYILGFFDTDMMIPSGALAGATLQITLESGAVSVMSPAGTADATWSITACSLVTDSLSLYDSALKANLMQQASASASGLQFPFRSFFNTRLVKTDTNLDVQINKATALCNKVFGVSRLTAAIASNTDVDASICPYHVSAFRSRLGSRYNPWQLTSSAAEEFWITAAAWGGQPEQSRGSRARGVVEFSRENDGFRINATGAATEHGWRGSVNVSDFAVNWQSSPALANSGLVTNGANLIQFEATCTASTTVDVWIEYMKLANFIGDSVVMDS